MAIFIVSIPGHTEDSYLGVQFGARALALGGAYSAVSDDGDAVLWNPAGLPQIEQTTLSGSQNHLTFTDNTYAMTLSVPMGKWGATALSIQQLTAQNTAITRPVLDASGNPVLDSATNQPLVEITGFGDEIDATFLVGYGVEILPWMALGASGKALLGNSGGIMGSGYGTDAGLLLRPAKGWRTGLVFEDIGYTIVNWRDDTRTIIEPSARLGVSWEPVAAWLFSVETGSVLSKTDLFLDLGAEWRLADYLILRAGMQDWRMTGGVGFRMPLGEGKAFASADYSFITGSKYEDRNRLSLAVAF